jgi:hypothetical protein
MQDSPQILVTSDRAKRANYLLKDYVNIKTNQDGLFALFRLLEKSGLNTVAEECQNLSAKQDWISLANVLLKSHYDKRYDRSIKSHERQTIMEFALPDLRPKNFKSLAKTISETQLDI